MKLVRPFEQAVVPMCRHSAHVERTAPFLTRLPHKHRLARSRCAGLSASVDLFTDSRLLGGALQATR
jgi:hypothetical protein